MVLTSVFLETLGIVRETVVYNR